MCNTKTVPAERAEKGHKLSVRLVGAWHRSPGIMSLQHCRIRLVYSKVWCSRSAENNCSWKKGGKEFQRAFENTAPTLHMYMTSMGPWKSLWKHIITIPYIYTWCQLRDFWKVFQTSLNYNWLIDMLMINYSQISNATLVRDNISYPITFWTRVFPKFPTELLLSHGLRVTVRGAEHHSDCLLMMVLPVCGKKYQTIFFFFLSLRVFSWKHIPARIDSTESWPSGTGLTGYKSLIYTPTSMCVKSERNWDVSLWCKSLFGILLKSSAKMISN